MQFQLALNVRFYEFTVQAKKSTLAWKIAHVELKRVAHWYHSFEEAFFLLLAHVLDEHISAHWEANNVYIFVASLVVEVVQHLSQILSIPCIVELRSLESERRRLQ